MCTGLARRCHAEGARQPKISHGGLFEVDQPIYQTSIFRVMPGRPSRSVGLLILTTRLDASLTPSGTSSCVVATFILHTCLALSYSLRAINRLQRCTRLRARPCQFWGAVILRAGRSQKKARTGDRKEGWPCTVRPPSLPGTAFQASDRVLIAAAADAPTPLKPARSHCIDAPATPGPSLHRASVAVLWLKALLLLPTTRLTSGTIGLDRARVGPLGLDGACSTGHP